MKQNWTVVDALRHSRHDWLNRLQLIKAHLSLGNEERVQELIHQFVGEAQQEARLMNLKMPLLTELLLTYTWDAPPCSLEYEVIGACHALTRWDDLMTGWTKQFVALLHTVANVRTENNLCITIEQEEEDVRFFFDFRGKLETIVPIQTWLTECETVVPVSYSVEHEEICIEIQLT